MNKKTLTWELCSLGFTIVCGSLLHFLYSTYPTFFTALISPVNESTWEHLKLLFMPSALFSVLEYFVIGKNIPGFFVKKAFGILLGMAVIVTSFYTYSGILGFNFLIADIGTFALGALTVYFYFLWEQKKKSPGNVWGLLLYLVLTTLFFIFTLYPPQIGLFQDPLTGGFGIV